LLFLAQSRPLQQLRTPFYLYGSKAFKLLQKQHLTLGVQKIQQNLLPRTFGLMQMLFHVVSIKNEEERTTMVQSYYQENSWHKMAESTLAPSGSDSSAASGYSRHLLPGC